MKKINIIYILASIAGLWFIPVLKNKLAHSEEFFGIAENPVKSVNFDYPVEIVRVYKKQGETFLTGDTILTLRRLDLRSKETSLQYELADNDSRLKASIEALSHDIAILENQKNQIENEFRYDGELLRQAQQKYITSQQYLIHNDSITNPVNTYIPESKQLETNYRQKLSEVNLKIRQKHNDKTAYLLNNQLKASKLQKELEALRHSEGELTVVSSDKGMIGQLDFGAGDRIPEFTQIVKFYDEHPSIVIFYIGDQQLTLLNEGDSLWIESINTPNFKFKGAISSMGNRITNLPERLKKIPEQRAWGREVQVQIPLVNPFLQGEKVKVHF
ncbi:MAG: hypothetical protein IPM92_06155 [Saprospiraceae bacterium]|nr:hypothetical protein [Saprospiraceae bacterium]